MDEKVLQQISKETMQQYESIRQSGVCNMFNMSCVAQAAGDCDFKELQEAASDISTYKLILMNFSGLMKHYEIKQE